MRRLLVWLGLVLSVGSHVRAPEHASAQDDWSITRERPKAPPRSKPGARPSRPGSPETTRADLSERYVRALLARPDDAFALDRLRELSLARDGSLDGLLARLTTERDARPAEAAPREALARVLALAGRSQEAERELEAALALPGGGDGALLFRAQLRAAAQRRPEARADYEALLSRTQERALRKAALRALGDMALDDGDLEAARTRYSALANEDPGDAGAKTAWARALSAHARHAEAAQAYLTLAQSLHGDPRASLPILREAASEQLGAGDVDGALATLHRAAASASASMRAELYELEVEAYRRSDRLAELAEQLERDGKQPASAASLGRAALLWDELGEEARALAAYRGFLARFPRDVDVRARLARLLVRSGRLNEVLKEYELLVAQAPDEPRFVIALAELLRDMGRPDDALRALDRASQRAGSALSVHRALAEIYARWEEPKRAARELELLTRLDPDDSSHLIALGDEAFARGDRKTALAVWQRILTRHADQAEGHAVLAQVLGDHDWLDEALAHMERALQLAPDNLSLWRAHASLLERAGQHAQAEHAWQHVLDRGRAEPAAMREARQHLVVLWLRLGLGARRAQELEARFARTPPDLEAGRTLAELYARDPSKAETELSLLESLADADPRDIETLLALERAYTRRGARGQALATLERMVSADPANAAGYLTRAVDLALSTYRDDAALRYAQRALELRPSDGKVQRLVGDLYRRRQDLPRAVAAYERAAELDPRDFDTRMTLAQIENARGNPRAAARWWLTLVVAAPDDELVARAVRAARELELDAAFREELESKLLELALSQPERPLYRRLLIECYALWLAPRAERVEAGAGRSDDLDALSRAGKRAIKPLLEALADADPLQRSTALRVLGAARAKNAGPALLVLADEGQLAAERARALIALGQLGDASLGPPLRALLGRGERRLKPFALWALARSEGPRAGDALRAELADSDASVRVVAALLIGALRVSEPEDVLRRLGTERHTSSRAAALWALARLNLPAQRDELLRALDEPAPLSSVALTALQADHRVVAGALFAPDAAQRSLAARLLTRSGETAGEGGLPPPPWPFSARGYLELLAEGAADAPPDEQRARLASRWDSVIAAAAQSLAGTAPQARAALDALVPSAGGLLPRALLERGLCLPPQLAARLARALAEPLGALAASPDPALRDRALEHLARSGGAEHPSVLAVLDGGDPAQREHVLDALADVHPAPPQLRAHLLSAFDRAPDWPTRLRVARVLGPDVGQARLSREPVGLVRATAQGPREPPTAPACADDNPAN